MTYIRVKKERVIAPKRPKVLLICACGCGKEFKSPACKVDQGRKYYNMEHYYNFKGYIK